MASSENYTTKQVLKLVAEALQLDSMNQNETAYSKYLESISIIAATLLNDRNMDVNGRLLSPQREKLIDTIHQCLDRISFLSQRLDVVDKVNDAEENNNSTHSKAQIATGQHLNGSELIADIPSLQEPINGSSKNSVLSVLEAIDWVATEDPMQNPKTNKVVSPLEKATRLNQKLMATYESRMSRCTQTNSKMNMALELHRRMEENLKVAREHQMLYLRNIQEKQRQRFQEVTKKVSRTDGAFRNNDMKNKVDLYMEVLKYSEDKKWVEDCKKRLQDNPKEEKLVDLVIKNTLRDSNHPITKWLAQKLSSLCGEMKTLSKSLNSKEDLEIAEQLNEEPESSTTFTNEPEDINIDDELDVDECCIPDFEKSIEYNKEEIEKAMIMGQDLESQLKESKKQQKKLAKASVKFVKRVKSGKDLSSYQSQKQTAIVKVTKSFQDEFKAVTCNINEAFSELVELFVLTYEQLEDETNRDHCAITLESEFFPRIWPDLLELCDLAFAEEIKGITRSMEIMANVKPADLELNVEKISLPSNSEHQKIIQLLIHMMTLKVPHEKLKVLVHVIKILCSGSTKRDSQVRNLGADDLIPLLNYVCIRSKLSALLSECYLLESFINPKYLMGEEGYCLTSLLTAMKYIQSCEMNVDQPLVQPIETTV